MSDDVVRLPENPNLEQYKKRAKELHKAHGAGDAEAAERIVRHHPRAQRSSADDVLSRRFSLSDAPLVIARELGFESWPRLKRRIDQIHAERGDAEAQLETFRAAVREPNPVEVRRLLTRFPGLRERLHEPLFEFGRPAIVVAKDTPEIVDVLLDFGADINARSHWAPGSFGVLDGTPLPAAEHLIARGARVDVHAAAHLGKLERLMALLDSQPELVHARGPDGQLPLHVAGTVEVVDFLLDRGADIEARDIDHVATAAQYSVRRPEVCRRLIERGAEADVFIGAALGDISVIERALVRSPESLRAHAPVMLAERSDDSGYYYPDPPEGSAHIYTWAIGFGWSPAFAAHRLGHAEAAEFLLARCSGIEQLAEACARVEADAVARLSKQHGHEPRVLHERKADLVVGRSVYLRSWEKPENVTESVRSFLEAGFSTEQPCYWGATPLHWAAWFGHADATRLLLAAGASVQAVARITEGRPLGWALHGCFNPHPDYDQYLEVVRLLVAAGAPVRPDMLPTEDPLIDRELEKGLARTVG
jgi:hypothetical protein